MECYCTSASRLIPYRVTRLFLLAFLAVQKGGGGGGKRNSSTLKTPYQILQGLTNSPGSAWHPKLIKEEMVQQERANQSFVSNAAPSDGRRFCVWHGQLWSLQCSGCSLCQTKDLRLLLIVSNFPTQPSSDQILYCRKATSREERFSLGRLWFTNWREICPRLPALNSQEQQITSFLWFVGFSQEQQLLCEIRLSPFLTEEFQPGTNYGGLP